MKYQIIYILIGLITLIINIVLLIAYLRLNFFILSKKTENVIPKKSAYENSEENITDSYENTVDFEEDN